MIYKFTYSFSDGLHEHVSTTEREALLFFDILVAAKCDYIRVVTFTKNCKDKH